MLLTHGILLTVWFFVLGAMIGSFLNVVVYRLPLKLSLVYPGSHCPKCKNPVKWFDNIPIFSWFILRGKCRHCGQPFSIRYAMVEALTAGMFAAVAAMYYAMSAAGVSADEIPFADDIFHTPLMNGELYGLLLYPLILLCTLLCAGLIEYDRQRVPRRLFFPAILVGIVTPLFLPAVQAIPAWRALPLSPLYAGLTTALCGGGLGAGCWAVFGKIAKLDRFSAIYPGIFAAGIVLGWQAVAIVTGLTVFLNALTPRRESGEKAYPTSIWLFIVTLGWVVCSPMLTRFLFMK